MDLGDTIEPMGFPGGSVVKNLPATAGAVGYAGSIPGLGRSPGVGNGNQLQYSCLLRAWTLSQYYNLSKNPAHGM